MIKPDKNLVPDQLGARKIYLNRVKKTSKFPANIKQDLKKEATKWEAEIRNESPEKTEQLMNKAESFEASRPTRQPVSLRMDPFDISIIKRLARKKGLPHAQLMSMWLHERVEKEKQTDALNKGSL